MKYTIKENIKLIDYLINALGYKRNKAKVLLSKKQIMINGKNISQFDYELKTNDSIEIGETNKSINELIDIIYEDDEFIAINKPEGLLSISSEKEKDVTAYHLVREYVNNKHEKLFVLHRLDKDTSGVLVFVKKEKLKNTLQDSWNEIVKTRKYYGIVEGQVEENKKRIVNYLKENRAGIVYASEKNKYSKEAITEYKVIHKSKSYSLLDINIETGRKNQIRVTMADLNHPIIGDKKYGEKKSPIYRLGLHAYELSFINPINKKEYIFKTDMPDSFKKLFNI